MDKTEKTITFDNLPQAVATLRGRWKCSKDFCLFSELFMRFDG